MQGPSIAIDYQKDGRTELCIVKKPRDSATTIYHCFLSDMLIFLCRTNIGLEWGCTATGDDVNDTTVDLCGESEFLPVDGQRWHLSHNMCFMSHGWMENSSLNQACKDCSCTVSIIGFVIICPWVWLWQPALCKRFVIQQLGEGKNLHPWYFASLLMVLFFHSGRSADTTVT